MDSMTPKKDAPKQPEAPKPQQPTAPTPAPATTVAAAPAQPSKQTQTLDNLKAAWTKRGVDLSKMQTVNDGKFLLVVVADNWPDIVIGVGGGIDLPQIKSYPKAFDAAIIGDQLLAKQNARLAKLAAPAPATKPKAAVQPEAKKAETPAAKKQAQHEQIEKAIENHA